MSWSISVSNKSLEELKKALIDASVVGNASTDQVSEAIAAALNIAESDCVGDTRNKKFTVVLSGHANPSHEPAPGMSNDMVSVSVHQF